MLTINLNIKANKALLRETEVWFILNFRHLNENAVFPFVDIFQNQLTKYILFLLTSYTK